MHTHPKELIGTMFYIVNYQNLENLVKVHVQVEIL